MKYILEFWNEHGTLLSDEEHSVLESDVPIPIPNVEDEISFGGGEGPALVKVIQRRFYFSPTSYETPIAQIQIFCRSLENRE